jgi:hypothetical protein
MSQLPLRSALIGAGDAIVFHMQAWGKIPQAEIVAIVEARFDSHKGMLEASLEPLKSGRMDQRFVNLRCSALQAIQPFAEP